jgi:hypothetical protein
VAGAEIGAPGWPGPAPVGLIVGVTVTVGVAGPLLNVSVTVEPEGTLAPVPGLAETT